ncbi:MAG: carbon monoxide dehydrogenase subunit G [Chloroflexi bacterium]|nr:carbon monoxide dehydrogenase subunit G [Chloroflexota bacterium]
MSMNLKGNLMVDAPREEVWKLLFDVDVLKMMLDKIPGITVKRLVQVSDDKYEATANIGVAMVKGTYAGTITVLEKRAPEYVKFRGEGKGSGNWTSGDMAVTLAEQGNQTLMTYDGVGNISGPLASLGQRLIDMVGKQFIGHGTKALGEELAARTKTKQAV